MQLEQPGSRFAGVRKQCEDQSPDAPPRHLRAVAAPSSSYGGAVGPPPGWRLSPTTSGQGSGGRISLFAFRMRIACEFAAKRIGPPHFCTPFRMRKCSENGCTSHVHAHVQSSRPDARNAQVRGRACVVCTSDHRPNAVSQSRARGFLHAPIHGWAVGPWPMWTHRDS